MSASVGYCSCFGDTIRDMLRFRASLGFSESTYACELKAFDRFCMENYPLENNLTKALALEWGSKRPSEKVNNHRVRLFALRQLGKFMNLKGLHAYIVPMSIVEKYQMFEPYLFTEKELPVFFKTIDTIPAFSQSAFSEYTLPVFFRIAYGCGLRPNELFDLRRFDVNLRDRNLFIYNSKTKRDRLVKMTEDLNELCGKYDLIAQQRFPNRHWFFHIDKEIVSRKSWFEYRLAKYWKMAELDKRLGRCPRIYDFRHNFATNVLFKWFDEGKDIMSLMPYLSAYMGHVEMHSTLYYVHLLPERLRRNNAFNWSKFEALLPEVPREE